MKISLLTALCWLCAAQMCFSQNLNCPPNIDFKTGTLNNWACFTGNTSVGGNGQNIINLSPSTPTAGRHELITAATTPANDEFGNFPKLCPYGGTTSVKLGNTGSGGEAEGISYTFQIPPSADTFSLTYYYAVVFEDPGHNVVEQPRFFVSAYDVLTGALINCASYNYVSGGSIPGFQSSVADPGVLYKDWTPASIDFSGLAGRLVRLEFKTADCTLGGHFGYAYLDVGTGCGGLLAGGAYCVLTNSVTLNAPYGFQTYTWYNDNYTVVQGNSRIVTISPPPPITSLFHVDMIPYPGYGCRDTADAQLEVLPVPDTPVAVSFITYCQNDVAQALSATAAPAHELIWYTSPTGGSPIYFAPRPPTNVPGTLDYYVSQKTLFGCESLRKKITVVISPVPVVTFTINNPRQCELGNSFFCSSTATNTVAGTTYLWDFGDGFTSTLPAVAHTYASPGSRTITLKVFNTGNCFRLLSKSVVIVDKPVASFTYPPLICENQTPIVLQSSSFVPNGTGTVSSWWWKVGTTIFSSASPAPFTQNGGMQTVKLVVATAEGCLSDTASATMNVHYAPVPAFRFGPLLCDNELIQLKDLSYMPAGAAPDLITAWNWSYDTAPSSSIQNPSANFSAGPHQIKLVAASDKGCNYRSADSSFVIYPKPAVSLSISDSCVRRNILFSASVNSPVAVNQWYMDLGTGLRAGGANQVKYYSQDAFYNVVVIGETINKCKDTLIRPFTVFMNKSKAMRDTIAATDEPVQLNAGDTTNVFQLLWSPDLGLSSTTIATPVATYEKDIFYELNSLTVQGCESYSKINVRRYDGPQLYVPTAFTPNNDGKNDVLKVFPVGFRDFKYFAVFNRSGQRVFYTEDYRLGWNGRVSGTLLEPGNYVWMAMAVDYKGKSLFRKGNVLMLR